VARAKGRKRTTPAQVKAYLIRQLTEAYGPSWATEVADHLDSGGDVYVAVTFT